MIYVTPTTKDTAMTIKVKSAYVSDNKRIGHLEAHVEELLDRLIDLTNTLAREKNEAIKIANAVEVRLLTLERKEREREQADAPRVVTRENPVEELRREVLQGTRVVWVAFSGSPLEGFAVNGPFASREEACDWVGSESSGWWVTALD